MDSTAIETYLAWRNRQPETDLDAFQIGDLHQYDQLVPVFHALQGVIGSMTAAKSALENVREGLAVNGIYGHGKDAALGLNDVLADLDHLRNHLDDILNAYEARR